MKPKQLLVIGDSGVYGWGDREAGGWGRNRRHLPGGGNVKIGLHQIQGASLHALQQPSLRQSPAVAHFPQQQSHRNATEQHTKANSHKQLHQGEASATTELRHGLGAGTTRC